MRNIPERRFRPFAVSFLFPCRPTPPAKITAHLHRLREMFGRDIWLAARCRNGDDATWLWELAQLSATTNVPMVTNDVRMHVPDRKPLMDAITCIREHCTIDQAGFRLPPMPNGIKPPEDRPSVPSLPEAVMRTMEIADRCGFAR